MRDYSINATTDKWKLGWNYVAQLDQQVWNLYDYIKEYNPNYQILNDQTNYYSTDELIKLGLYNDKDTPIKVNANLLNNHQGLLNNFHQECSIALSQTSNSDSTNEPELPKLPEGYLVLSQVKSNDWSKDSVERQDIKNYLVARVAAPATYYALNNITATSAQSTRYTGVHEPNAELTYGLSQYYSFLPNGVNFYYYQPYNKGEVANQQAVAIRSDKIVTEDGSRGVNGYALNHVLMDSNTFEEIICDDQRSIEIRVEDTTAYSYYRIQILNQDNDNNEPFLQKFPMNVRLG